LFVREKARWAQKLSSAAGRVSLSSAAMKRFVWQLFSFLLTVASTAFALACIYNLTHEAPEIDQMARDLACAGKKGGCEPQMRWHYRTPFSRRWVFALSPQEDAQVVCERAYVLAGDYHCARVP
jgi:hypothetical protein